MANLPPFDVDLPWFREMDDRTRPPVARPSRRYHPDSLAGLIAIVQDAEKDPDLSALELRAVGSHWAFSGAAVSQKYVAETADPDALGATHLNQTLYDVVPDCLSEAALRFFRAQGVTPFNPAVMPDHSKFYLYHVEAGTRIWELYCRLDADDHPKRSLAASMPNYMGPWAMETLGGAGGQTVAGAFSTGTHGGDVGLGSIADAVQAIHLVGPTGKQYWFEKPLPGNLPLVDDDKLKARYKSLSEIEVVRDPDRFNATIVSVGRMGIIYSVVFKVVRQFSLHEVRSKETWSDVKKWVNNIGSPIFKNRFVGVVINPNAEFKSDDDHICYVTLRTLEPIDMAKKGLPPFGRAERCLNGNAGNSLPLLQQPGDFSSSICASDSPAHAAIGLLIDKVTDVRNKALLTAAGAALALALPFLPLHLRILLQETLDTAIVAAAAAELMIVYLNELRDILPTGPLGKTMCALAGILAGSENMEWFRFIAEAAIDSEQSSREYHGVSYGVMDLHNYLDIGCSANGDSLEVFFDAANMNLTTYIEKIFTRVNEMENGLLTGQRLAFPGYVALRFMGRTAALIGMQRFPETCSLEIASYLDCAGTLPFLSTIEQDAINLGATVHWGQRNDLNMKQVEEMYDAKQPGGALYRWREALALLTDNGRLSLFTTAFTRDRGLEVVQPRIKQFSVRPSNACANEPVLIEWKASSNPPGTAALLEILPSGSSGPPVAVIPLATLDGAQQVAVPAGSSDFTLVVATTLNKRTLTDRRALFIRGLPDHDTFRIVRSATCLSVDGQLRWGVEVSIGSTVSASLAVEAVSCNFAGVSAWTMRRSGVPDVLFLSGSAAHALPTLPTLQGTWLFFVKPVGCGGGAPQFDVDFQVVCKP